MEVNVNNDDIKSTNTNRNILQWRNLTITVTKKGNTILDNLTGETISGESLAIMGSSGAGKTTFLNYLSQKSGSGISGLKKNSGEVQLIVNNLDETNSFRSLSGYVTQDDFLFDVMTPRELLHFAAALRLPNKTLAERTPLVENLITRLGLEKCSETQVGNVLKKGLSGGEKKRTAIGYELVTDPLILFLDEPTTGLDSASALKIVNLVTEEAKLNNRIVVFTIHQPNSEIFSNFDKLMLMSGGKIVYHGDSKSSIKYFSSLGYECPPSFNPAEYFIKILSKENKFVEKMDINASWNKDWKRKKQQIENNDSKIKIKVDEGESDSDDEEDDIQNDYLKTQRSFSQSFSNFQLPKEEDFEKEAKQYEELIQMLSQKAKENEKISDLSQYPVNKKILELPRNNFVNELYILLGRQLKILARSETAFFMRVFFTVFVSLLVILIFNSLGNGDNAVLDRNGCLFFITSSVVNANLQSNLLSFTTEKLKFYKEQENSMYGVTTYFLSKTILELPIQVILTILVFVCTYFMAGLSQSEVDKYFIFMLVIFITGYAGSTFAVFFSSLFDRPELIPAIFPFIIYTQIQASGFYVALKNVPYIFYPFEYISVFRYSYQALAWNEYEGQSPESLDCRVPSKCKFPTDDFEESLSLCIIILAIIAVANNILSVIALKIKVSFRRVK